MQVSETGVKLIQKYEGLRLEAYRDPVGVWTIGYGHTKGVKPNDKITKEQATAYLKEEIARHVELIPYYVKVKLSQQQFDALASFHYNLGRHILSNSKLLKYLNEGQWKSAAEEMKKYNKAGGKVLNGLTKRRNEEAKLFLGGSPSTILQVDGNWGEKTTRALQKLFGTTIDGEISGQPINDNTESIYSVDFGHGGSQLIRAMQKHFRTTVDGVISCPSYLIKAMNTKLGVANKGVSSGRVTQKMVKELQKAINNGTLK